MNRAAFVAFALSALASTPALGDTHYMSCFGGGRAGLYWSAIFAVPPGPMSDQKAKAFNAFVKGKYGVIIFSECHSDLTQANAESAKKIREDSDQNSRFPSKLIETGWMGK